MYWKALPLRPGIYKVDIVIKDVNNPDHIGTWRRSVNVPKYDDDRLSASSLILASSMQRVCPQRKSARVQLRHRKHQGRSECRPRDRRCR